MLKVISISILAALQFCTCRGNEDIFTSAPKSHWDNPAFGIDSLKKAQKSGVTPFHHSDIDTFTMWLHSESPRQRQRGLFYLTLDARFGKDDPKKCTEIVINHLFDEDSIDVLKKGMEYLREVDPELIIDRKRFFDLVKKQPESLGAVYILGSSPDRVGENRAKKG